MQTANKYDERAAGGIVYKIVNGEVMWLVIKALRKRAHGPVKARRGQKNRFVYKLPKGHLNENEFLKQAAIREVAEEGKVKAEVVTKIGSNNYVFGNKCRGSKVVKRVTFFLMRYVSTDNNEYSDAEKIVGREWLPIDRAIRKLGYESERKLLQRASRILASMQKNNN